MKLQVKYIPKQWRNCIIAYGSNQTGTPKGDLPPVEDALGLLSSESVKIINQSAVYQSRAFPPGSGPDFINGVVAARTNLSPQGMIQYLHNIEQKLGRTRIKRWGPRVIDLDLIDFDGEIRPDIATYQNWVDLPLDQQMTKTPDRLILPHPRLQDRVFVLLPLQDVAPDWVHPVTGDDIKTLLARFSPEQYAEIRLQKAD